MADLQKRVDEANAIVAAGRAAREAEEKQKQQQRQAEAEREAEEMRIAEEGRLHALAVQKELLANIPPTLAQSTSDVAIIAEELTEAQKKEADKRRVEQEHQKRQERDESRAMAAEEEAD